MSDKDHYKPEYTTLGQAASSPYATIGHNTSVSGLWGTLESNYGDVVEGGTIIDKRNVDSAAMIHGVVSGPMLDEGLPAGHANLFVPNKIVPATVEDKFGGFDTIALDLYLALWRKVGARVGHRIGDTVVWEDGKVDPIPPADKRYPWQTGQW